MSTEHHFPKIEDNLFLLAINDIGMYVTTKGLEWKWFNKEIQNSCKKWNGNLVATALESWGASVHILFYF